MKNIKYNYFLHFRSEEKKKLKIRQLVLQSFQMYRKMYVAAFCFQSFLPQKIFEGHFLLLATYHLLGNKFLISSPPIPYNTVTIIYIPSENEKGPNE